MVQFHRMGPSRKELMKESLGRSIGQGLSTFINNYFAGKALDDVINNKEFENAPMSERSSRLERALRPYGQYGANMLQNRIGIEQQLAQEREQRALAKFAQGGKLSEAERLSLSIPTQQKLMQFEQQREQNVRKLTLDKLASDSFSKGYKAILDGNLDDLKTVIEDPQVPLQIKTQLAQIQNQFSNRKDVKAREQRSRQSFVQNAYSKAIGAERGKIGKMGGLRKEEVAEINQRIKELEGARQKDMQRILKNPESYPDLSIWGNTASEFLPHDEEDVQEEEAQESPEIQQRVEFLNSKFPPKEFQGKKKQDKSGRVYQSDGKVWQLVQK